MEHAARRPMLAVATLTTAGALALTPITVAPPELTRAEHLASPHLHPGGSAHRRLVRPGSPTPSSSVVELAGDLRRDEQQLYPLPNPIFIAPIATQLVINPLIYAVQLFTGQGAQIPTEIADHLSMPSPRIANVIFSDLPPIILQQIQTPFLAAQLAIDSITTATNKLIALLEAPAVFFDAALNSQYGLIGSTARSRFRSSSETCSPTAIDTTPPTIVLPFKKAGRRGVDTESRRHADGDCRHRRARHPRPGRSPRRPPSSSRKAASAKASNSGAGSGHSKRG